jgi:Aminotransferase class-V
MDASGHVYMVDAATTPVAQEVLEAMLPWFRDECGNADSLHTLGAIARHAVELAREQVASAMGADTGELYFTSGGTESNNWAVKGVADAARGPGVLPLIRQPAAMILSCCPLAADKTIQQLFGTRWGVGCAANQCCTSWRSSSFKVTGIAYFFMKILSLNQSWSPLSGLGINELAIPPGFAGQTVLG